MSAPFDKWLEHLGGDDEFNKLLVGYLEAIHEKQPLSLDAHALIAELLRQRSDLFEEKYDKRIELGHCLAAILANNPSQHKSYFEEFEKRVPRPKEVKKPRYFSWGILLAGLVITTGVIAFWLWNSSIPGPHSGINADLGPSDVVSLDSGVLEVGILDDASEVAGVVGDVGTLDSAQLVDVGSKPIDAVDAGLLSLNKQKSKSQSNHVSKPEKPSILVRRVLEICDDGVDNNDDGLIDCDDKDCTLSDSCRKQVCTQVAWAKDYTVDMGEGPSREPRLYERILLTSAVLFLFLSIYLIYRLGDKKPTTAEEKRRKEELERRNEERLKKVEKEILERPVVVTDEHSSLPLPKLALSETAWILASLFKQQSADHAIDYHKTVMETIKQGGQFTPIPEIRKIPQVLTVMVDIESGDYVWLGRVRKWIYEWEKRGVYLDIYEFRSHPATLEHKKDETKYTFEDIARKQPGPLMIFSRNLSRYSRAELDLDESTDPKKPRKKKAPLLVAPWIDYISYFSASAWIDPQTSTRARKQDIKTLEKAGLKRFPLNAEGISAAAKYLRDPDVYEQDESIVWPKFPQIEAGSQAAKSLDLWCSAVTAVPDPGWDLVERLRQIDEIHKGLNDPQHVVLLLHKFAKDKKQSILADGKDSRLIVEYDAAVVSKLHKEHPEFAQKVHKAVIEELRNWQPETIAEKIDKEYRVAKQKYLMAPTRERLEGLGRFLDDVLTRDRLVGELEGFKKHLRAKDRRAGQIEIHVESYELSKPLEFFTLGALMPKSAFRRLLLPLSFVFVLLGSWNIWDWTSWPGDLVFGQSVKAQVMQAGDICKLEEPKSEPWVVNYVPKNAKLRIDGKLHHGKSGEPILGLEGERLKIDLEADCRDFKAQELKPNQTYRMKRITRSSLKITTEPAGVEVRVNGKRRCRRTPCTIKRLRCGRKIKLGFEKAGFESETHDVVPLRLREHVKLVLKRPDMAYMPGGVFWMGCVPKDQECVEDEKPRRKVRLTSYWIDKTEVTVEAYRKCVDKGDCERPRSCNYPDKLKHPVNCVTWHQAKTYCESVGKRLPTEAQWERAARGKEGDIYPWGSNAPTADLAVFGGDTLPVASKTAAAHGLYDMAGNVWEWVQDCYQSDVYKERVNDVTIDPVNSCSSGDRVLRGGSYDYSGFRLRSSDRDWVSPGVRYWLNGFRCALSN